MSLLTLTIPGEPHAQGRPRVAVINGRPRVYDPAPSRKWKAAAAKVIQAAMLERGVETITGPITMTIFAVFSRPRSSYRKREPRGREPRVTKPDADNVAKAVMDAAESAGLFQRDSQVYSLTVTKITGAQDEAPRVEVTVLES